MDFHMLLRLIIWIVLVLQQTLFPRRTLSRKNKESMNRTSIEIHIRATSSHWMNCRDRIQIQKRTSSRTLITLVILETLGISMTLEMGIRKGKVASMTLIKRKSRMWSIWMISETSIPASLKMRQGSLGSTSNNNNNRSVSRRWRWIIIRIKMKSIWMIYLEQEVISSLSQSRISNLY